MEKIIQISSLIQKDSKIPFGYVGKSLKTGKIKYYYLHNQDENNSSILHEFDINNINCAELYSYLKNCSFQKPKFSPLLPDELKETLTTIINKHRLYNQENAYQTECIDMNEIDLSVQPLKISGLRRTIPPRARYNSLENIIEIKTTKEEWEILSEEEKERKKNSLIHEVGHLKVTKCFLTENILNIKTGFCLTQYYTKPIKIEDKSIFYKLEKEVPKDYIQIHRESILEEIINDYDCLCAFPNFHRSYPRFGEELNNLCDKKLLTARNENNIDEFYNRLYSIIPNKDLIDELLETIYAATYGTSKEKTEEKAREIVKKYEKAKINML